MKILIIDDEKAICNTLKEILQYEKYDVDIANDGEEGVKKAKAELYDLVLCDIKMPKMDGLEVLAMLQQINPEMPVVMISGHGTIETAVDAIRKGAYDYISKPPDLNRLLITVRNALDRSTLITETKTLRRKIFKTREMIGESSL